MAAAIVIGILIGCVLLVAAFLFDLWHHPDN